MEETLNLAQEPTVTPQKLVQDMKALVNDAEDLVKATAGKVADKTRDELQAALDRLRASCRNIEGNAMQRAEAADTLIRTHPYQSIGIAFGMGLLIGVLVNR